MVMESAVVMEGYSGDGGVQCMFWGVVTKFVHANCIDIPRCRRV